MLDGILSRLKMLHIILPAILVVIIFHELAHGLSAYLLGDPTAKEKGRLTLNPIVHIDIAGFLLLIFAGFGWAKPVPINPRYFKNRKLGTILVSVAGPFTNFIMAIIVALILSLEIITNDTVFSIVLHIYYYNILFGVFNLLPFPPLDGSKVLASLLPIKYEIMFYRYERYLYSILLILVITNGIGIILEPVRDFSIRLLYDIILYF